MKVTEKHASKEEQKAKIRRRYQGVDPGLIECIPGKPQVDFYDNDAHQRVAVYVRVSTGDPNQTSSSLMDNDSRASASDDGKPLLVSGKRIKAIPESWARTFGYDYYSHQLDGQPPEQWDAHSSGTPFPTDVPPLSVTEPDALKTYITGEINSGMNKEDSHE